MWLWLSDAHQMSFLLNRFSVKYRLPFPILCFFTPNHLALLKDRFLKKMLLKRAKTKFQVFKIAKFEFKVTVHSSPLGKMYLETWKSANGKNDRHIRVDTSMYLYIQKVTFCDFVWPLNLKIPLHQHESKLISSEMQATPLRLTKRSKITVGTFWRIKEWPLNDCILFAPTHKKVAFCGLCLTFYR